MRGWLYTDELFVVREMRHFVGPNDVNTLAPRWTADWWYVEAYLRSDPDTLGRWIYEMEEGLWAEFPSEGGHVGPWGRAPGDSKGFGPGIWLQGDGDVGYRDPFWLGPCTPERGPYCECPWGVLGCTCASQEDKSADEILMCTGLPLEVMGCLSGL